MNEKLTEALAEARQMFEKEINEMASKIFMESCVACGGNWNAMLWSGFKAYHEAAALTDEEFKKLDDLSESLAGNAGVNEFLFLSEMSVMMIVREQLRITTKTMESKGKL